MNTKHNFLYTQDVYFYYDINHNRIIASNDKNYPALPFVCSENKYQKAQPYHELPQHNLYYILADDGKDLNSAQRNAIKKFKAHYSTNPKHVPLLVSQENILFLIEVFQNNLSQNQVMHIISADLNEKTI